MIFELEDNVVQTARMKVVGDVAIAASETSLFAVPRTMRLEADVAPR